MATSTAGRTVAASGFVLSVLAASQFLMTLDSSVLRTSLWVVTIVAVVGLFFTGLIPVRPPGRPGPEAAAAAPAEATAS